MRESHAYSYVDMVSRDLVVGIEARLLGTKNSEPVKVNRAVCVPADWWQAFRERWAPRWWLRRCPVLQREIAVEEEHHEHWHVCPHLAPPNDRLHVLFMLRRDPQCCDFCKRRASMVDQIDCMNPANCRMCGRKMLPEAR